MKKDISIFLILICWNVTCLGQNFSIANEHENIVTVGLVNPISITVENMLSKNIVAKTDNGELTGDNGQYDLIPEKVGRTTITIFKNANGKLKKIGQKDFRAKLLWDPIFKIGSGERFMKKEILSSQQYVRAELENSDFQLNFNIDSFKVCIVPTDTCSFLTMINVGSKISEEIIQEFKKLKVNDAVIFKDIYCTGPGGQRRIEPRLIFISQ